MRAQKDGGLGLIGLGLSRGSRRRKGSGKSCYMERLMRPREGDGGVLKWYVEFAWFEFKAP